LTNKRDPEATQAALLEAAEEIFLKKGFGNTSLSQIANQAGVTKSLIHHYFESKENLWREVKQRRFSYYLTRQMDMLEEAEPTADLLEESIRFYFRFLAQNPEIVQIMAWMFLERDQDECLKKDQELNRVRIERIRQAQKTGKLRDDIDPRFILFSFIGLAQHWIQDKKHFMNELGTEGLPEDLDEAYLDDMIKIFMGGVLPR